MLLAVKTVHRSAAHELPDFVGQRDLQADAPAFSLEPRHLLGHQFKMALTVLTDEQRRRMVVAGERAQSMEDLIEEILGPELLHHFPIDSRPHINDAFPVLSVDRL